MMELRKPPNFKGVWQGVINQGTPNNPLWLNVKQTTPKQQYEIIRNPKSIKEFNDFSINSSYINTTLESSNITLREIEDAGKISVISFI